MDPTEATPLLGTPAEAASTQPTKPDPSSATLTKSIWYHLQLWSTLYLCGLFIFLVDFGAFTGSGARLRMLELGICRNYYAASDPDIIGADGNIPEELCKGDLIQGDLAQMRGILGLLEHLPGMTLAIPYGVLADMFGRKLIVTIGLLGLILRDISLLNFLYFYETFPLQTVYISPLFAIIGGGPNVISATTLAIIAAATSEANRTQSFLYISVTILISELVAPPFSALLLDKTGPYITFLSGLLPLFLGFFVLLLLPRENMKETTTTSVHENIDSIGAVGGSSDRKSKARFTVILQIARRDVGSVFSERAMLLGIVALAIQKLTRPMLEIVLQYMSVKFGWLISDAVYIMSVQAAVQIILFLWIVPKVYRWLLARRENIPEIANLALARLCITFLTLGSLGLALAPFTSAFISAIILYTCGTGFSPAMRSFLTSHVQKDRITTLYTTMALTEGISSLAASPLLGLAFSAGIARGHLAMALPFFITSVLYVLSGVSVWFIQPNQLNGNSET